jgi:hypothetical protein
VIQKGLNAFFVIFLLGLPQLDTIISRILTYSQDFNSLERKVMDKLNEFEHHGYMKAYFNKGFTAKSNHFHIMYVFSTLPPGGFHSHVSTGQMPSHSFVTPIQVVEAGLSNGTGLCPFVQ